LSCIAPDRTRRRAPGWRSSSGSAASRGSGPWPAASRPGWTTGSRWSPCASRRPVWPWARVARALSRYIAFQSPAPSKAAAAR
jgi:hypothetical protein